MTLLVFISGSCELPTLYLFVSWRAGGAAIEHEGIHDARTPIGDAVGLNQMRPIAKQRCVGLLTRGNGLRAAQGQMRDVRRHRRFF